MVRETSVLMVRIQDFLCMMGFPSTLLGGHSVREGGCQVIKTFLCSGEPVFQEEAAKCGDSHFYGRWPWAHDVHKPSE